MRNKAASQQRGKGSQVEGDRRKVTPQMPGARTPSRERLEGAPIAGVIKSTDLILDLYGKSALL